VILIIVLMQQRYNTYMIRSFQIVLNAIQYVSKQKNIYKLKTIYVLSL